MEFGIWKCDVLIMERGRLTSCHGIVLPDNKQMRSLDECGDGCKYHGVLEADDNYKTHGDERNSAKGIFS